MFESAELGHTISDKDFDQASGPLREALLDLQFELDEHKPFPVVVIVAGVSTSGKGETINTLVNWMDPRKIESFALDVPTQEERERPPMWRFWRALPPKGRIGVFFGSWYTGPVYNFVKKEKRATLDKRIDEIVRFERMLAAEGALIVKVWLHLTKDKQRDRLRGFEKDRATRWRVDKEDWEENKNYRKITKAWQHVIRLTNTAVAPWHVVDASDSNFRLLTVAETLRHHLANRLKGASAQADAASSSPAPDAAQVVAPLPPLDGQGVLSSIDLTRRLEKSDYKAKLAKLQARLNKLSRHDKFARRAAVLVFEGNDAAGKGGAIRRVATALDARYYKTVRIAAPTEEERAHPYLWRFWRHIPRQGRFTIFDRSWYGRVLVERVEGFAAPQDWMRAYGEINDFEHDLSQHGIVPIKFWLSISKDEQARRFQAREETGFKRFKITDEDWRNREKWDEYAQAVTDMVDRTSTAAAPWHLIAAEDKRHARVTVLETICDRIEEALD